MIATAVISVIIFALVAWIIISKIRKKGQGGCGCGCRGCSMSDACHKE